MKLKNKILSSILATIFITSSIIPTFAEKVIDSNSITTNIERKSTNTKVKTGNQKVLCVMVNMDNAPFDKKHNEKFYYEQLFGKNSASLKNYINNQSNGNFKISPADTINTKYKGVVKINVKATPEYSSNSDDYPTINRFVKSILPKIGNKVNWKKIDTNNDKQFVENYLINDISNNDELLIITVISGDAYCIGFKDPGKIIAWSHNTRLNTYINGYHFDHSTIITSEFTKKEVGYSTFAHEVLHDLGARDMYKDEYSINFWSVMGISKGQRPNEKYYTPTPLDPAHKLFFGWKTPKEIKFNKNNTATIKFNKKEIPYIKNPKNPDIIYLLNYHDFNDSNEKSLYRHGIKNDGVSVWKIHKTEAIRDWSYNPYDDNDFMINSKGKGTAIEVMTRSKYNLQSQKHSYINVNTSKCIDGTKYQVFVKNKQITIRDLSKK